MVTLTTGVMFLLFTCMHFWACWILWKWSACAPTAYEVVSDYLRNTALRITPHRLTLTTRALGSETIRDHLSSWVHLRSSTLRKCMQYLQYTTQVCLLFLYNLRSPQRIFLTPIGLHSLYTSSHPRTGLSSFSWTTNISFAPLFTGLC
jgi:hypothetical protein